MLARQGRTAEALDILDRGAAQNDPAALFELAIWRLAGSIVPRDLEQAREYFKRAAAAGHSEAARVYNAFLANGTGATPDWRAAADLLRQRASSDTNAATQLQVIAAMRLTGDGDPIEPISGQQLSKSPHVELFPKALSAAECRFLAEAAEPLMQPAVTVDPRSGQQLRNPVRTSDAAGFPLALENPAIHALNRRIAALARLPVSHGEPLQVLRYRPGQQYRVHSDALPGTDNQRVVTVLVYLNAGYSGGETHFPASGLSIRGEIGDALLFRNVGENGRPDERAIHAGLPVTSGTKLIASRWIRARPLNLAGGPA